MAVALAAQLLSASQPPSWVFWSGLAIASGLALLGVAFELFQGNVCPRAFGWLPMCYVSLVFSIAIGSLYPTFSHDTSSKKRSVPSKDA